MNIQFLSVVDLYPYGASEIRRSYRRSLAWALGAAVFFPLLLMGSWLGGRALGGDEVRVVTVEVIDEPIDIGPPPSVDFQIPDFPRAPAGYVPKDAFPIPAPDSLVPEDATIPTREELRSSQPVMGAGGGDSLVISPGFVWGRDREPEMDDFVAVEAEPVPVVQVRPEFPRLAREAEIEGRVMVRGLVDREGRVKRVVVVSGPAVFYEAARAAALQWVFKPAIQKDRAISVWVTIPFDFRFRRD